MLLAPLEAQQRDTSRTRRDTVRGAGDTVAVRRDSAVLRDTTRDVRVPVPPGPDSLIRRDSVPGSTLQPAPRSDTLKAPIAAFEAPVLADPTGSYVWDRRDVFSTGALTVQDLLDRVTGATGLRTGWIAQPMATAYLGDPRRIRVWLDGLELTELDPRANRVWDLTQIPLWALDDIRIERSASEIRVHLRSWRVERTTPFTRTDVYTGDQGTNLYRGLFGRRYQHGEVLQLAAQQYGTSPGRSGESSDALGVLGRLGWANGPWSADAFLLRLERNRGRVGVAGSSDTIPGTESSRSEAYLRLGWGRSDAGLWVQGIANASRYAFGGAGSTTTGAPIAVDTSRSGSQYLLASGYSAGPLRASLTQRFTASEGRRIATPAARLSFDARYLVVSAFAEGRGDDSTRRGDVTAVVRPTSFVFASGSYGVERPREGPDSLATTGFLRGEAGLRVGQVWLSGGVLRRDPVLLDAPALLRGGSRAVAADAAEAVFASVRGRVWKSLYADLQGIQWSDSGGYYRPKFQSRSELYLSTSLLERYPSGNLHILASVAHEYRSTSYWPDAAGPIRISGYRTLSSLIQVRVIAAEVFWSFRNFMGERYVQVPGHLMPRLVNIYGVRWEFWN